MPSKNLARKFQPEEFASVSMDTHAYACMHAWVHTNTHTHTHTHTHTEGFITPI